MVEELLAPFRDDPKALKRLITDKNEDGHTALHLAAYRGHDVTVAPLLAPLNQETVKALIQAKDSSGNTACHIAAKEGHDKVVDTLLTYAKNIDDGWKTFKEIIEATSKLGETPLNNFNNIASANKIIETFINHANRDHAPAENSNVVVNNANRFFI
ncbi:ankyrin repeat domain-containing protein [Cardinium endosymbiont of Dermatophagoides farinae]|uniref:ankyrin repeat domain-containing protein n=1 Tax=Cardinium endosymbiont of Dermatophagoides farinae TaxID=2597823 RepID=UPI003B969B93